MNKLKAGDKVVFIINNEFKTGIINSIQEPLECAYVQSDGISLAIDVRRLVPVTDGMVETEEPIEAEEIVDEITISKIQFMNILSDLMIELTEYNARMALAFTIFGAKLVTKLFDTVENE